MRDSRAAIPTMVRSWPMRRLARVPQSGTADAQVCPHLGKLVPPVQPAMGSDCKMREVLFHCFVGAFHLYVPPFAIVCFVSWWLDLLSIHATSYLRGLNSPNTIFVALAMLFRHVGIEQWNYDTCDTFWRLAKR
jgi:hypothetical protein